MRRNDLAEKISRLKQSRPVLEVGKENVARKMKSGEQTPKTENSLRFINREETGQRENYDREFKVVFASYFR